MVDRIRSFLRLPEAVGEMRSVVTEMSSSLAAVEAVARRPPPPATSFVSVLVTGHTTWPSTAWTPVAPLGKRTTLVKRGAPERVEVSMGDACEVREGEPHTFELRNDLPLTDVRVVCFADLRRVVVGGIYCGTTLCTAAMGACPIAMIREWPVGVVLRVQCNLRAAT
jgi:hypothetical protein